jgi:hypothetical protein
MLLITNKQSNSMTSILLILILWPLYRRLLIEQCVVVVVVE